MQKIDLINLDKSNWQTYRFDQIAKNISERVDPNNTDLQVYIGLEHIDPESIHIKRSGTPDDVDGQKLRFYPGDVIFGRRRAYQRKAAIATTDGFCSAHALVLRANPEVINPQLFPFFLHSDAFMHRAVDISVGSLSPTINWGTLKHQEFLLPPKDQQAKLVELLWMMDRVIESDLEIESNLNQLRASLMKKFQTGSSDWEKFKIKDLMDFSYGKALKEADRQDGQFPVVSSAGIQGTHNEYIVKGPGIVVGRKGNAGEVTWVEKNFWPIDTAYFIEIKNKLKHIPIKFFYYLLQAVNLKKHSIATAVPGLNRDDAMSTNIYLPPESDIKVLLQEFEKADELLMKSATKIISSKSLQKSLINQIF